VRRSRLVTARRAPFWVLLTSGLLALASAPIVHVAFTDRWRDADGLLPEGLVRLTVLACFALMISTPTALTSLVLAIRALEEAPVEDVAEYGGGRRVDLVWPDRYATRGRIAVEELPDARVTATRRPTGGRILPATVADAGGPGCRVIPRLQLLGPTSYEVTSAGPEIRVTVVERAGGVDTTLDDGHGTRLRWRHRPVAGLTRLTLLDDHGTAWWVRRTGRTSVRAELPDELHPVAARALVLVAEDQMTNATREGSVVAIPGGDVGAVPTGGD
jgi:hypothetical protein